MTVKVLILEDNPVTRGFLCRVVSESFSDPCEIVEAGDLATARRALGSGIQNGAAPDAGGFQLMLLDLELPDGNGLSLLRELNGSPATRIVTTLYADDEHLFPALQYGAHGYLLKEDRFEVLVEELQKIVRGQRPLSPTIARRLLHHFRGADTPSGWGGLGAGDAAATSGDDGAPQPLEPREGEVLTYLSKGFSMKEIGSLMGIKWFTVNDHIKSIYKKLSASSVA